MPFDIPGSDTWQDNVRGISVTDPVLGGSAGASNYSANDLADRTKYLKEQDFRDMQNQVESASGGTATIRQDAAGLIDYFHILEKFKPSDLDSDLGDYTGITGWTGREYHPAFYVNGTLKDRILISIFNGVKETVGSTDYMKQAINQDPSPDQWTISELRTQCTNKGTGYHLLNYLEFAALGLMSLTRIAELPGNDDEGKSYNTTLNDQLWGRIYNPAIGNTYAGSGGLNWRHNQRPWGVADIVGNIGEVLDGIYVNAGQIYMFSTRDNNYSEAEGSYTGTSIFYDKTPDIRLHNSVVGSSAGDILFQGLDISSTLQTAGNELIDSSYITDVLMCRYWNKSSVLTTPGIIGSNALGVILAKTLTAKAYLVAGGSYDFDHVGASTGYGSAGLGSRGFETDSTILAGRCALIE